jgi:hypothetical protein
MRRYREQSGRLILSFFPSVLPVAIWTIIDLSVGEAHWVVLERRIVLNTRKQPHFKEYTNFASWHTIRDLRCPIKDPISSSELIMVSSGVLSGRAQASGRGCPKMDVHQRPANKGNSTNRHQ